MSEYKKKNVITYRIEQETHGSYKQYTTTHIRIDTYSEVKVSEKLYWTCKEPDYYGPPEPYQLLAAQGHEKCYEINYSNKELYLSYLHSEGGYCAHKIGSFMYGLPQMRWAYLLLTKISRQIAKAQDRYYGPKDDYSFRLDSPQGVVDALKAMGAVEIEYTGGSAGTSRAVARFSPEHTFMVEAAA